MPVTEAAPVSDPGDLDQMNHDGTTLALEASGSGRLRLVARFCGKFALMLFAVVLVLGGAAVFILRSALPSDLVRERLVTELQKEFGGAAKVDIGDIKTSGDTSGVSAEIKDLKVRSETGQVVLAAPHARVDFSSAGFSRLELQPVLVTLRDVNIAATVGRDGAISISGSVAKREPTALQPNLQQLFSFLSKPVGGSSGGSPRLALENGRLDVEDLRSGRHFSIKGINAVFETDVAGKTALRVAATGQSGAIAAHLSLGDVPYSLKLEVERVSAADIGAFTGADLKFVNGDLPLSFSATTIWSDEARISSFDGIARLGKGQIYIDDPDAKPIEMMQAQSRFAYKAGSDQIAVTGFNFEAGGVSMQLAGFIGLPSIEGGIWPVKLTSSNGTLSPLTQKDQPVQISDVSLLAKVDPAARVLKLEALEMRGPKFSTTLSGQADFDEAGRMALKADLSVTQSDARTILHIWPAFVAPELRQFLVLNLAGGKIPQLQVATAISVETFAQIKLRKPMPAESVSSSFTMTEAAVTLVPGVPPLSGMMMKGQANGRQASISGVKGTIKMESGRVLQISDGIFSAPDLAQHPVEARSQFRLTGPLEGVAELLALPALKGVSPVAEKNDSIKGNFDGQVNISVPLKDKILPTDVNMQAKANLTSVVAERFFGKDNFEAPSLQFTAQTGVVALKGDGKVGGIPAQINLVQPRSGDAEDAVVMLTLDEAARVKRGLNLAPQLTGPVTVTVKSDFPIVPKAGLPVEVDLTKATMDGLLPGWVKPAGKSARLKFTLNERDGGYKLTGMELDSSGVSLKGSADLATDGSVISFQLTSVVLSPGDSMQVDGQKTANGMKINVRANSFDARPFLRGPAKTASASTKELELDMKVVALGGFNGEIASNAEIRVTRRGALIRQGTLSAKLNGAQVSAKVTPRTEGQSAMVLTTKNAGALLRFMDIYNRMQSGTMDLHVTKTGESEAGYVIVHDFILRDEPALKRAAAVASKAPDTSDQDAKGNLVIDGSDVAFTKLKLDFTRKGDYFDVSDAVMWGRDVGGTLSGQLDYGKDRVNLTGTFVPAFGLNNAFAKIPVLGIFLAGNKNEGLFAVPFQITGRASQPSLTINPIAAVSPGFLRKIFDFKGATTGTLPSEPE